MVVKQCSISARPDSIIMRSEGTLCEVFIMFNVSFIGTCEKGFYVEIYKQVCGTYLDFLDLLYKVR